MLKYNKDKMENFGRVLTTCIFDTIKNGLSQIPITNEDDYIKQLTMMDKCQGGMFELVGLKEYQVKPYFDIDYKDIVNKGFNESIIDDICNDIQSIHNCDIFTEARPMREIEEKDKKFNK